MSTTTTTAAPMITPAEITNVISLVGMLAHGYLSGIAPAETSAIALVDTDAKTIVANLRKDLDAGTASPAMEDVKAVIVGIASACSIPLQSESVIVAAIDKAVDDVAAIAAAL